MAESTGSAHIQRVSRIKNLIPRLHERGKIKIGGKGRTRVSQGGTEFQLPERYDHFVVTTMDRDSTGNFAKDETVHTQIGEKPTEIPIRLLYDEPTLNFVTRLAAYKGKTLWCTGDGETASRVEPDGKTRKEVSCPCERSQPGYHGDDKCKMAGALSAMIDVPGIAGVNGFWTFRTTSYNSVVDIYGSLLRLHDLTYGVLAGVPLKLVMTPKHVINPDNGKPQTVYTAHIDVRSGGVDELQAQVRSIQEVRRHGRVRIEEIENEARARLAAPDPSSGRVLPGDDPRDVQEEFHPDPAEAAEAAKQAKIERGHDLGAIKRMSDPVEIAPAPAPGAPASAQEEMTEAQRTQISVWWTNGKYKVKKLDQFLKLIPYAPDIESLRKFTNANEDIQRAHADKTGPAIRDVFKKLQAAGS